MNDAASLDGARTPRGHRPPAPAAADLAPLTVLLDGMEAAGVQRGRAKALVDTYGTDRCATQLRNLAARHPAHPGRMLIASIIHDYEEPMPTPDPPRRRGGLDPPAATIDPEKYYRGPYALCRRCGCKPCLCEPDEAADDPPAPARAPAPDPPPAALAPPAAPPTVAPTAACASPTAPLRAPKGKSRALPLPTPVPARSAAPSAPTAAAADGVPIFDAHRSRALRHPRRYFISVDRLLKDEILGHIPARNLEVLLYFVLTIEGYSNSRHGGWHDVTIAQLCERLHRSKPTIIAAVDDLCDVHHLLERQERRDALGRRLTTRYHLQLEDWPEDEADAVADDEEEVEHP